ncbi:MAG: DUF362 domain-containing protein [Bacillota bacterium]
MARCTGEASRVWVKACLHYEEAAVRSGLEALGDGCGLGASARGRTVFCKVNAATGGPPARARSTHPVVVKCLVSYLYSRGATQVYVGDSSAAYGHTRAALASAGITQATQEAGGLVVDIDSLSPRRLSLPVPGDVFTGDLVLDSDLLVSVAKLKTHSLAGYTGALKNLLGTLMGAGKARVHQAGGRHGLYRALVELIRLLRPRFGVLDGIVGMEGNGPSDGQPRLIGLLAASSDLVALDTFTCQHTGINLRRVPLLGYAALAGLGCDDPARIAVCGDAVAPLHPPLALPARTFRLPEKIAPLARTFYRLREVAMSPIIKESSCTRCGNCVSTCPSQAISYAPDSELHIDPYCCARCFHCLSSCRRGAIEVAINPWLRPLIAARLEMLGMGTRNNR